MFFANNSKLNTDGSIAVTLQFFVLPAYMEYKPTFAPTSQNTQFSGNSSIHSKVSGSFVKNVSFLYLVTLLTS